LHLSNRLEAKYHYLKAEENVIVYYDHIATIYLRARCNTVCYIGHQKVTITTLDSASLRSD